MNKFTEKMKASPLGTTVAVLALIASGIAAGETTFGFIDKSVVTEAELHAELTPIKTAMSDTDKKSECRWLRSEIRAIKERIQDLESRGADPEWIEEKKDELKELEDAYDERTCNSTKYI